VLFGTHACGNFTQQKWSFVIHYVLLWTYAMLPHEVSISQLLMYTSQTLPNGIIDYWYDQLPFPMGTYNLADRVQANGWQVYMVMN